MALALEGDASRITSIGNIMERPAAGPGARTTIQPETFTMNETYHLISSVT